MGSYSAGRTAPRPYAWTQQSSDRAGVRQSGQDGSEGQIRAYIIKVTGLSLPQAARLIRMYRETGKIEQQPYQRRQFPRKYTAGDVTLLA